MDRPTTYRDDSYVFLSTFCQQERIGRSTVYRHRERDPEFPAPRVGKRYLRADLVRYLGRFR